MAKGKRNTKEDALFARLQNVVAEQDCVLVDLRFTSENKKRFLRLYIDKRGGVSIDDCEAVSMVCDPLLDAWGEDQHDYFEVQSPGLDRPLSSPLEFSLHTGEEMVVSLYQKLEGLKKFTGLLQSADQAGIVVELADGKILELKYDQLAQVKRVIRI
ncbi:MAG: ribosome maturation factor RimP [Eubacteriales bacterium]|nr:ribosome maturation factor RimP [Clostridiales bacterium]MDY5835587.1 ribosome maturation factor RimP [Eubacteriales bacterium]